MEVDLNPRVFLILMGARLVGDYLYAWGGESCDEGGYDCSGFLSTILMQTARCWPGLYDGGRQTAQGLYDYYHRRDCPDITEISSLKPGCLLFYRYPGKSLHHVALHVVLAPPLQVGGRQCEIGPVAFEAGGSGSAATTPRASLLASAGTRLTASDFHGNGVTWVAKDPFLLLEKTGTTHPPSDPPVDPNTPAELEAYRNLIDLAGAKRFNQAQSGTLWNVASLPSPLCDYSPGSDIFALAVAQLQSKKGLKVDGYLGQNTLNAIRSA